MFSIKMTKDGSTLLTEAAIVAVHYPQSTAFEDAIDYAASLDVMPPDVITTFPETYTDSLCEEVDVPGLVTAQSRDGHSFPIAVIVTDIEDEQASPLPGVNYQFVYPGDFVIVLDHSGGVLEEI